MDTYKAWIVEKRPIYSRLPDAYHDNQVANWLTDYWDELLVNLKEKIDDLPRQLNPMLCDEVWLDFLAPLCGFTSDYWDISWSVESKRILLANSYSFIWKNKGTKLVLSFILNTLGIDHEIWQGSDFILGSSQVSIDRLGDAAWEYKILLPAYYSSDGYEFQLARRINNLFGCIWCKSEVRYKSEIITELFNYVGDVDNQTILAVDDETLLWFE